MIKILLTIILNTYIFFPSMSYMLGQRSYSQTCALLTTGSRTISPPYVNWTQPYTYRYQLKITIAFQRTQLPNYKLIFSMKSINVDLGPLSNKFISTGLIPFSFQLTQFTFRYFIQLHTNVYNIGISYLAISDFAQKTNSIYGSLVFNPVYGNFIANSKTHTQQTISTSLNLTGWKGVYFQRQFSLISNTSFIMNRHTKIVKIINQTIYFQTSTYYADLDQYIGCGYVFLYSSQYLQIGTNTQYISIQFLLNQYNVSTNTYFIYNNYRQDRTIFGINSLSIVNIQFSYEFIIGPGYIQSRNIASTDSFYLSVLTFIFTGSISDNRYCCGRYFVDVRNQKCQSCPPGCTNCLNYTYCTSCAYDYIYNSINNSCDCSIGAWRVSGICINVTGCFSVVRFGGQSKCVFCILQKHFIYDNNGGCICRQGFEIENSTKQCKQICGDGKIFKVECDDGNKQDGDGCSSVCKIEKGYNCSYDTIKKHSICNYKFKNISIQVKYITKLPGKNKGIFQFQLNVIPQFVISQKMINNVQFTTSKNISVDDWYIQNNFINIFIDFNENLQDQQATIIFYFNSSFVSILNFTINFIMDSNWIDLIFEDSQYINTIHKICVALIIIILLAAIVSIVFHKTIALQTILTYQIIFFIFLFFTNKTYVVQVLEYFSIFFFNVHYFQNKKFNIYANKILSLYSETNFNTSHYLVQLFLCLFVIIIVFRRVISFFIQNQKKFITKITTFIYQRILFFSLVSLSYFIIFASNNINTKSNIILLLQKLIIIIVLSFEIIAPLKSNVKQLQTQQHLFGVKNCNRFYLPIYLSYIVLIFTYGMGMSINYFNNLSILVFVITFLMLTIFCLMMPYNENGHNFGQISNLILIQFFSGWGIYKQYLSNQTNMKIQLNLLIVFLFLILLNIFCMLNRLKKQMQLFWQNLKCLTEQIQIKQNNKNQQNNDLLQLAWYRQNKNIKSYLMKDINQNNNEISEYKLSILNQAQQQKKRNQKRNTLKRTFEFYEMI